MGHPDVLHMLRKLHCARAARTGLAAARAGGLPGATQFPISNHKVSHPNSVLRSGSSFGGICTLWACMHYPGRFGAALVESPSLWFADEKFLR